MTKTFLMLFPVYSRHARRRFCKNSVENNLSKLSNSCCNQNFSFLWSHLWGATSSWLAWFNVVTYFFWQKWNNNSFPIFIFPMHLFTVDLEYSKPDFLLILEHLSLRASKRLIFKWRKYFTKPLKEKIFITPQKMRNI